MNDCLFMSVFLDRSSEGGCSRSSRPSPRPPAPSLSAWAFLFGTLLLGLPSPVFVAGKVFKDCGGPVEGERGVIHTPNFPGPFPDPISCLWVIRAPPGKKIHLYFTQYFLRESFYVAEFDTYTSRRAFTGRNDLEPFDFRDHVTSVVGHKPVLTVEFRVRGKKNIHLRVDEFLNDVYGFNITYEVVDVSQPRREDICGVYECSFLGHCLVTANWTRFYCACFPGYSGNQCQFGPYCDPAAGRNLCLNGGTCSYFYGSYVNKCECPPGYIGDRCETRTEETAIDTLEGPCANLHCSQLCEINANATFPAYCTCREGFRLQKDNATCELIEMHRVELEFVTQSRDLTEDLVNGRRFLAAAKQNINRILKRYKIPQTERFNIDSFTIRGQDRKLSVVFYVESSKVDRVRLLFGQVLPRFLGLHLLGLPVKPGTLRLITSPELRLLNAENYEKRAAPVGSFSNLVCEARGSNQMKFRWLKEGRLFNASLTTRNVWHIRIPQSGPSHYQMSILNMNDVSMYDKGTFACEVEDFGEVQRMEVELDVVTRPLIIVTPLSANVRKGETVNFRCFSPDERLVPFSYRWLKNGKPFIPGLLEMEVDLQPRGKGLTINNASNPANYTCIITTPIMSAGDTAYLFVSSNDERCPEGMSRGMKWQPAMSGGFDVQKCPAPMAGWARRTCSCQNEDCKWNMPNTARCQSLKFIAAFDKMEQLRLGYQGQSLTDIYTELLALLRETPPEQMVAGDVYLASRMMLNGMTTALDIPDILLYASDVLPPKLLLELLGLLIHCSTIATPEEQKEQRIISRSLVVLEVIAELMATVMPYPEGGSYTGQYIDAAVKKYTDIAVVVANPNRTSSDAVPSEYPELDGNITTATANNVTKTTNQSEIQTTLQNGTAQGDLDQSESGAHGDGTRPTNETAFEEKEGVESSGTTYYVTENLDRTPGRLIAPANRSQTPSKDDSGLTDVVEVLEVVYGEALLLIENPARNWSEHHNWQPLTKLHSILPVGNLWEMNHFRAQLVFHHPMQKSVHHLNETFCFALLNDRHNLEHHWSRSQCVVTFSSTNQTTCICSLPAHVAVFIRLRNERIPHDGRDIDQSSLLLIGSVVSLCGLIAVLLSYLLAWRNLSSVYHMVRFNFTLSLLVVLALCVICLRDRQVEIVCLASRLLLHLTLLAAFSFLFVDTIHMYVVVNSHSVRVLYERGWKYLAIGWGIPLLSMGSTALTSWLYEYKPECHYWCWVDSGSWHFYPFLIPMLVFVLACLLLSAKCVWTVSGWTDEWRFRSRKKNIIRAAKNGVVLVILLGVTWSGCDVNAENAYGVQVVFVLLLLTLVVIVSLAHCITERRIRESVLFFVRRKGADNHPYMQSSFRAFIMPEKIEEQAQSTEEQDIHRLCTERDNSKFTAARKRQLRFLLGSSSGSDESENGRAQVYHNDTLQQRIVLPGVDDSWEDEKGGDENEGGGEEEEAVVVVSKKNRRRVEDKATTEELLRRVASGGGVGAAAGRGDGRGRGERGQGRQGMGWRRGGRRGQSPHMEDSGISENGGNSERSSSSERSRRAHSASSSTNRSESGCSDVGLMSSSCSGGSVSSGRQSGDGLEAIIDASIVEVERQVMSIL